MIRLVLGRKELGKSTLGLYLSDPYRHHETGSPYRRRLAFDPKGDFRRPGAAYARTADGFRRGMDAFNDGELAELVYARPYDLSHEEAFDLFAAECRAWLDAHHDQSIAILIDESKFVTIPPRGDFMWVIKGCKAERHHFFLTAHRPVDVAPDIRGLADYWYLFRMTLAGDLDTLREHIGDPRVLDTLGELQGQEFLCWDDRKGEPQIYRDPSAWFVDMAPPPPAPQAIDLDAAV